MPTQANQVQKQKTPRHCSYCDRDYHSIEMCYYLHGFPVGQKLHGKDMKPPNQHHSNANNVMLETNKESDDGSRLTTEEYNKLMAMIQKNNDGNSQHFANATGIITLSSKIIPVTSYSNLCWIIDSGATDHVTSSVELLTRKVCPNRPPLVFRMAVRHILSQLV